MHLLIGRFESHLFHYLVRRLARLRVEVTHDEDFIDLYLLLLLLHPVEHMLTLVFPHVVTQAKIFHVWVVQVQVDEQDVLVAVAERSFIKHS